MTKCEHDREPPSKAKFGKLATSSKSTDPELGGAKLSDEIRVGYYNANSAQYVPASVAKPGKVLTIQDVTNWTERLRNG